MTDKSRDVMASYHRCRRDPQFVDSFYELFLAMSPEIARMFGQTDFTIQKLMLRESLLELLCFDQGVSGTREEIERLGRRHQTLEVKPEMYVMWLDALCAAIQKHDPDYTPELEQRWRAALQRGIDVMITASDS